MTTLRVAAFIPLLSFGLACAPGAGSTSSSSSSSSGDTGGCTPGQQSACACAGGATGFQVCNAQRTFDACVCGGAGSSSEGASSADPPASTSTSTGTSTGTSSATSSATSGPAPANAPVIDSVVAETSTLHVDDPNSPIELTILASDPQGVTDLASAELRDRDANQKIKDIALPVAGSGNQATLTTTIRARELNDITPITFETGTGSRALEVVIRDHAGHEARSAFPMTLDCASGGAACSGECVDLMASREHCGTCAHSLVPYGSEWLCGSGQPEASFGVSNPAAGTTCTQVCAMHQGAHTPTCELQFGGYGGLADYRLGDGNVCFDPNGTGGNTSLYLASCSAGAPGTVTCADGTGMLVMISCSCTFTF